MDTRFWGPSGWRLLHLIAASPIANKQAVKEWFELLEYVLPCKYCRASFHDYMNIQPLTDATLKSPDTFGRWVYDIHNRVNAKLRGQGLLTASDPAWPTVKAEYARLSATICHGAPLIGWEFLVSVANTTPNASYTSVPMPDLPENKEITDIRERNRYNLLNRRERIEKLTRWWSLIPSILPCKVWRDSWGVVKEPPPLSHGRKSVLRWMWYMEESVCSGLQCSTPHPSLLALKKEVSTFESNCAKNRRGKTCRTRKRRRFQKRLDYV